MVNSERILHSDGHPERFTELHEEEEWEEGDRYEQEEKKGGFKRGETDLGSTLFPKCSPQLRTPTEIHRIGLRREGGEEIEVIWGRKRRFKRGREWSNQSSHS